MTLGKLMTRSNVTSRRARSAMNLFLNKFLNTLMATIFPVSLSTASKTSPYAPLPIRFFFEYLGPNSYVALSGFRPGPCIFIIMYWEHGLTKLCCLPQLYKRIRHDGPTSPAASRLNTQRQDHRHNKIPAGRPPALRAAHLEPDLQAVGSSKR